MEAEYTNVSNNVDLSVLNKKECRPSIVCASTPISFCILKWESLRPEPVFYIWVRSRNCDSLVTWFCYQLIAKTGNKTATVSWPDPYGPGMCKSMKEDA